MAGLPAFGETVRNGKEDDRLAALADLRVMDTRPEDRFDLIARIAAQQFRTPMAFINLIGRHRQSSKAAHGFAALDMDRSLSICAHTIQNDCVFVVHDMLEDSRFSHLPIVTGGPKIRFYAGAPLVSRDGHRLGAICVVDTEPHKRFSSRKKAMLRDMAALAVEQFYLRRNELLGTTVTHFANATELACVSVDAGGRIEFINRAALELFECDGEYIVGKGLETILPERGTPGSQLATLIDGDTAQARTVQTIARTLSGREFPAEISLSTWQAERGTGVGAIIRDISERLAKDRLLEEMAIRDPLTGLFNRRHFESLLRQTVAAKDSATVVLIDLDEFKDVNDSLGHSIGDELLQAFAARIPLFLTENAVFARFGSDEFAILLPGLDDPLKAQAMAEIVLRALDAPLPVAGHSLYIGASIGFAILPGHGETTEEVIGNADFALYRAKQAGGRAVCMFEPEMRNESTSRRAIQEELARALRENELVLHYQPQVSLETGELCGMEALLRWQHPERGLLYPDAFIAALEASALASPVGWWVLDEVCRQIAEWRADGYRLVKVGVNLFPIQFRETMLVQNVIHRLYRHDVPPALLELEVTEKIALSNDDQALTAMRSLQRLGVQIAFDDFGTGFASLSSLQRFPLTTLKIDRSFVRDMLTNHHDAAITRAVISMANDLGLETVAEGIEIAEQAEILRTLGCKIGQGYMYGKPMPAHALLQHLTRADDKLRMTTATRP